MDEIIKKENLSVDEKAKEVSKIISYPFEKQNLLKTIEKNLKDNNDKELAQNVNNLMRIYEGTSHIAIIEAFDENYRGLSKDLAQKFITENQCTTESEKAMAELAVNAYLRVLDNSRRLNNELNGENITPNRNQYIANLSTQIDRANRQFLQIMLTLKQLKAPNLSFNIKAETAFIADKQLINSVNTKKDESNEAK